MTRPVVHYVLWQFLFLLEKVSPWASWLRFLTTVARTLNEIRQLFLFPRSHRSRGATAGVGRQRCRTGTAVILMRSRKKMKKAFPREPHLPFATWKSTSVISPELWINRFLKYLRQRSFSEYHETWTSFYLIHSFHRSGNLSSDKWVLTLFWFNFDRLSSFQREMCYFYSLISAEKRLKPRIIFHILLWINLQSVLYFLRCSGQEGM